MAVVFAVAVAVSQEGLRAGALDRAVRDNSRRHTLCHVGNTAGQFAGFDSDQADQGGLPR